MSSELETRIGALGHASGVDHTDPPAAFLGRVRRRRMVRRAMRAGAGTLMVALIAGVSLINRPASTPQSNWQRPTHVYSAVEWPLLPEGGTGGPALPIRAGTRPTDPMAIMLLQ